MIDTTSTTYVLSLAERVTSVPPRAQPALAARIMADGLMLPSQWWLRLVVRIIQWRHGMDSYLAWASLLARDDELTSDLIGQTAQWIVYGIDRTDPANVGGFNHQEAERMEHLLNIVSHPPKEDR